MTTEPLKKTIVSPDVIDCSTVPVVLEHGEGGPRVALQPMPEWKQAAQRGVRSAIQCGVFLFGGGSLAVFAAQYGIAPDMIATIPTTSNKALDAALVSVVFGLLVFLWNYIEFWLDLDIHVPGWRA